MSVQSNHSGVKVPSSWAASALKPLTVKFDSSVKAYDVVEIKYSYKGKSRVFTLVREVE